MLGPPGSGKGTQGLKLAERYGGVHIASGDLLRQILASDEESELSRAVRAIEEGKFVSDEVAGEIVFRELDKTDKTQGFVLDGYPRNGKQAELLTEYLTRRGRRLDATLYLNVEEAELMRRLTGRLTCENCGETFHITLEPPRVPGVCDNCGSALIVREDDRPDRIKVRLQLYRERTEPVLGYYETMGLLRRVNGEGEQNDVFERCVDAIDRAK